ncbi:hypothetical protein EVAR_87989_1 [Eumeta japonica]|uniref:Uncharacterized protein n=1 Tax=Eumeta variegata TaxID=151549 RepID=A0A4C1VD02_EUMVA|nr:hypothetical protein EVAR_87989_1 [Eumeta japonica]
MSVDLHELKKKSAVVDLKHDKICIERAVQLVVRQLVPRRGASNAPMLPEDRCLEILLLFLEGLSPVLDESSPSEEPPAAAAPPAAPDTPPTAPAGSPSKGFVS